MKYTEATITRSTALDIYADPESLSKEEKKLTEDVLKGIEAEGRLYDMLADELEKRVDETEKNVTTVSLDIIDAHGRVNTLSLEHHKEMSFGDEEQNNIVTATRIVDMSHVYDRLQARFTESEEEMMDEFEEMDA